MSNGTHGGYQGGGNYPGGYPEDDGPPAGYRQSRYSQYEDEEGYDDEDYAYEDEGEGRSRLFVYLIGGLVVLGGLGALAYYAYQRGAASTTTAPVIITAEDGPVKVLPDDPGGLEVPNQDKLVYDRLTGGLPEDEDAGPGEHLLPPAEEPIDMSALRGRQSGDESDRVSAGKTPLAPTTTTATPLKPPASQTAATAKPAPPPQAVEAPSQTPAATSSNTTQSGFVVQIAALRDEATARATFSELSRKHPDLMRGLSPDVERADLGTQGVYYRLRLAPFASRDAANRLCASLKGRGQDCMVRSR